MLSPVGIQALLAGEKVGTYGRDTLRASKLRRIGLAWVASTRQGAAGRWRLGLGRLEGVGLAGRAGCVFATGEQDGLRARTQGCHVASVLRFAPGRGRMGGPITTLERIGDKLVGPAILLVIVLFLGAIYYVKQSEAAARSARDEQDQRADAAKDAEQERLAIAAQVERDNQATADIAECSRVVDALRCQRAFRCWAEPEICVIEHGDPDAVLEIQSRAELYQLIGDRAFDLPAN